VPGEDGFSAYDSARGGPSGNTDGGGLKLPPVVETLEAVETRVIPTPRQMAILTPPFPTRGNSEEEASPLGMTQGAKSMIGSVMSLLSIFCNNARVRG